MIRKQIASAVHVNTYPMDQFKTNQIYISFIMPLSERVASYASLLSMVLKTGCADYPSVMAMGKAFDELYGAEFNVTLRKKGDSHIMTFSLEFLDDAFAGRDKIVARALELLAKIVFHPLLENGVFPSAVVAREKKNLCDLIEARINDKRIYALRRCGELACQGQPYGVYQCGSVSCVKEITPESLFDFYADYLKKSTVEIFSFGYVTENHIVKTFEKYFNENRTPDGLSTDMAPHEELLEFTENYPVDQAKLSLAFAFDEAVDAVKQKLFVTLFGGSPSSLLFANVREKLSLCYYCSAMLEQHKNMMIVYSGVMPEKIKKAKEEILAQLDVIKKGEFTQAEFAAAKKYYANTLKAMVDSISQLEDRGLNQILADNITGLAEDLQKIDTLTEQDMCDMAAMVRPIAVYVLKGGSDQ